MSAGVEVRPMTSADVEPAEVVWREAFSDMRRRGGLPDHPADKEHIGRTQRRLRHFLQTDPGGCWVAAVGDDVVGIAQATRRGPLWVLSLLGVAVAAQGRGIGRRLLATALGSADPAGPAIILSSRDPRAMRSYVAAGFALHPVVAGVGRPRLDRLPAPDHRVRDGTAADLSQTAEVDRRVRIAAREADIDFLLQDGVELLVVEDRGYALVRGGQPVALAADEPAVARSLLLATLGRSAAGQEVDVAWLGAGQRWAIDVVVAAGLELQLWGAIMVRGLEAPPVPYIANGAIG